MIVDYKMEVWGDVGDDEKSEEHAAPSPLRPLRHRLTALRFIGFPLRFSDDFDDVLINKRWFGVVIFVQMNVMGTIRILNTFAFRTNLSEEDIDSSPLDMAFVVISFVPNFLAPLAYLWFYRGIGVSVSTFCAEFSNGLAQVVPAGDLSISFQKLTMRMLIIFFLYLVAPMLEALVLSMEVSRLDGLARGAIYGSVFFLGHAYSYFPPIAIVTLFFAMHVLQSLDIAFKKFIESLGQAKIQPSTHISAGLVLFSLTKRANAFLGGLLAVQYLLDLINVSCSAFFVARYGMAVIGQDGLFRYPMLLMAVNNALYAILSSARIYMLQDVGQKLCEDAAEARERIQRMRMENAKRLTAEETLEIDTLVDWLSFSSRAPIRPMDTFDMNYSSGASIVGLILTYMIILMQFKVSEMSA